MHKNKVSIAGTRRCRALNQQALQVSFALRPPHQRAKENARRQVLEEKTGRHAQEPQDSEGRNRGAGRVSFYAQDHASKIAQIEEAQNLFHESKH